MLSLLATLSWLPIASVLGQVAPSYRVNMGGPDVPDGFWTAFNNTPGFLLTSGYQIATYTGIPDHIPPAKRFAGGEIYNTELWTPDGSLTFELDVPIASHYTLQLHFMESFAKYTTEARSFEITVNGKTLTDFKPIVEGGGLRMASRYTVIVATG